MKKPPRTMFQIAAWAATGKTQTETAARFGISIKGVSAAIQRVRYYQQGQELLDCNQLSIRGLAQTGVIRESTARALEIEGITDLLQLAAQGKRYVRTIKGIGPISLRRIMAIMTQQSVHLAD